MDLNRTYILQQVCLSIEGRPPTNLFAFSVHATLNSRWAWYTNVTWIF